MAFLHFLQIRCLLPFSKKLWPILVALPHCGQIRITLPEGIGAGNTVLDPGVVPCFFLKRVRMLIASTVTLPELRLTSIIFPDLPLYFPVRTETVSPFFNAVDVLIAFIYLNYFRG